MRYDDDHTDSALRLLNKPMIALFVLVAFLALAAYARECQKVQEDLGYSQVAIENVNILTLCGDNWLCQLQQKKGY